MFLTYLGHYIIADFIFIIDNKFYSKKYQAYCSRLGLLRPRLPSNFRESIPMIPCAPSFKMAATWRRKDRTIQTCFRCNYHVYKYDNTQNVQMREKKQISCLGKEKNCQYEWQDFDKLDRFVTEWYFENLNITFWFNSWGDLRNGPNKLRPRGSNINQGKSKRTIYGDVHCRTIFKRYFNFEMSVSIYITCCVFLELMYLKNRFE